MHRQILVVLPSALVRLAASGWLFFISNRDLAAAGTGIGPTSAGDHADSDHPLVHEEEPCVHLLS